MRVATVNGLVTLYYDGSKEPWNEEMSAVWNEVNNHYDGFGDDSDLNDYHRNEDEDGWESWDISDACKEYIRERLSWQQVIVREGVIEIPVWTFSGCKNIKRVIFTDTVIRIERFAFYYCKSLTFIKWSLNLELIDICAFIECNLSSVFIPPRCNKIACRAFSRNRNLTIFNVPQETELGYNIIDTSKLIEHSRFGFQYEHEAFIRWLKNMNNRNKFALHRICSSFEPSLGMILKTMKKKGGPNAFNVENDIGITPSQYLKENPYADVKEAEIVKKFVLQMMGEL